MLGSQVRLLAVAPLSFSKNMGSKIIFSLKILFMIASLVGILYAMKILRERGGESISQNPIGSLVAPPVEPAMDVSASQ
jgi:hypothetical protein